MKKLLLLFFLVLSELLALTQTSSSIIRVSPDLELVKISENAYVHVSYDILPEYGRYASNGLIFIDNNDALLFDTPPTDSLTKILVTYLKEKMSLKITGFVPNHWHSDCMGGLKYLSDQSIDSYANEMTIEIAKAKNLPVPNHGFRDSLHLKLGDKSVFCYFPGAAHSLDNIVVWIPSKKILFPGCMCKSLNSENLGNTADGDISAYSATIDRLITKFRSAEIIIPGHGHFGGFDLLLHTKDLITQEK